MRGWGAGCGVRGAGCGVRGGSSATPSRAGLCAAGPCEPRPDPHADAASEDAAPVARSNPQAPALNSTLRIWSTPRPWRLRAVSVGVETSSGSQVRAGRRCRGGRSATPRRPRPGVVVVETEARRPRASWVYVVSGSTVPSAAVSVRPTSRLRWSQVKVRAVPVASSVRSPDTRPPHISSDRRSQVELRPAARRKPRGNKAVEALADLKG